MYAFISAIQLRCPLLQQLQSSTTAPKSVRVRLPTELKNDDNNREDNKCESSGRGSTDDSGGTGENPDESDPNCWLSLLVSKLWHKKSASDNEIQPDVVHRIGCTDMPPCDCRVLRIVHISDTHGSHDKIKIPDGDILIHSGDFLTWHESANLAKDAAVIDQFFAGQPHKHKVNCCNIFA
jgi:hypothetical protein